jgi:hypothetical protein
MELSSTWRNDIDDTQAMFVGRDALTLPQALAQWGPDKPWILIKRDLGSATHIDRNISVEKGGQSEDRPLILGLDDPDQPAPEFDRGIRTYEQFLASREQAWGLIVLFESYVAITGLNLKYTGNGFRLCDAHYHLADIDVFHSWSDFISCYQPGFRGDMTIRRILCDGMNAWRHANGNLHNAQVIYANADLDQIGDVIIEDVCARNTTGHVVHNKGKTHVRGKRLVGVNTRGFLTAYIGGSGEYDDCAWLRDDVPQIPNPEYLVSDNGSVMLILSTIRGKVRVRNSEFIITHPSGHGMLHHGDEALYEGNKWIVHPDVDASADGLPNDEAPDSPTSGVTPEDSFWSTDVQAFLERDGVVKRESITAVERADFMSRRWATWKRDDAPVEPSPPEDELVDVLGEIRGELHEINESLRATRDVETTMTSIRRSQSTITTREET